AHVQPGVHQPVLVALVHRHLVAGGRGVGHRCGDLAAQDLCIELERLAALPLEAEAGHDLHTSPPWWWPPGPGRAGVLDSRPYDGWGGGGSTWFGGGVANSSGPPTRLD